MPNQQATAQYQQLRNIVSRKLLLQALMNLGDTADEINTKLTSLGYGQGKEALGDYLTDLFNRPVRIDYYPKRDEVTDWTTWEICLGDNMGPDSVHINSDEYRPITYYAWRSGR